MDKLPMKKPLQHQMNVKLDKDTVDDGEYLKSHGVNVPELARRALKEIFKNAKQMLSDSEAS